MNPQHDVLEFALAAAAGTTPAGAVAELYRTTEDAAGRQGLLAAFRVFRELREGAAHTALAGECLDDNRVAEYVDRVLDRAERSDVERHLGTCSGCLRRVAALSALMHEVAPAPGALHVVLRLARHGFEFLSRPAAGFAVQTLQPAAVLSSAATERACRWTQHEQDLDAVFTVVRSTAGTYSLTVAVSRAGAPPERARLDLRCGESLLESVRLAASGEHTYYGLTPDTYAVEVSVGGAAPVYFGLELRPAEA